MNTWVEPPPRRRGLGCFARGCLVLLVFAIVLGIACFAGVFWGLQRHSAIVHGIYWLAKTHSIADSPVPVPEFSASDNQIQSVRERWQDFEQKTRAGQPAEIELTADDINTLIATNPDARGKVFVVIDGNQLRLQTSVPFGELIGRRGYYFNGDITVEFKGAESLENPQLNRIIVNGEQVPSGLLNWKYRSRRLREYVADYRNEFNIGTIEVRDGKLILRSRIE
jgi:hypothetical protein